MNARTVLISGANGGIGTALCQAFADSGWKVIASDREERCHASHSAYVQADLSAFCSDSIHLTETVAQVASLCDDEKLDALINNAAVQILGRIEDLKVLDWQTTLNVNLLAPFFLTQRLLPLLEKGRGSVVNISSIHAMLTKPSFTAYATSKAALSGLTRSMAVELGGRIRVNAICPGAIGTQMLLDGFIEEPGKLELLGAVHPCGRIGKPYEVATAALFLCSDGAEFITGSTLALDGGVASRLCDPV